MSCSMQDINQMTQPTYYIVITYNRMLETRDLTNNLHVMKEKWVRGRPLIDAGMIMTVLS